MTIEYILLEYCPGVLSSSGHRIGVVYRCSSASLAGKLHVYTTADWEDQMPLDHLDYIQDILSDLQNTDPLETGDVFEGISEMSSGILRTERSGTCELQDIASLFEEKGKLREWLPTSL